MSILSKTEIVKMTFDNKEERDKCGSTYKEKGFEVNEWSSMYDISLKQMVYKFVLEISHP